MKLTQTHLAIEIKRTVPRYFEATATYVLCQEERAQKLTKHRHAVTCRRCLHLMMEYGDKCVIPRGNVFTPGRQLAELHDRLRVAFQTFVGSRYSDETQRHVFEAARKVFEQYNNVGFSIRKGKKHMHFEIDTRRPRA